MHRRYRKILNTAWPYLLFIGVSIFILWFQYVSRAMILSGDVLFHVHQFYESAMQIKTGHYSWFMTMFGFGQTGRIINAVYGPVFSYLVGGLLLLVGTWARTQIILEFLVLLLSSSFMYYLSRNVRLSKLVSICFGCVYATSYPIITFLNFQTFDGIGNVLLPLIVLLGIRMLKSGKVRIIPLAILMAITFQIHVVTTLIASLTLIPFALVGYFHSSYKLKYICHLIASIGLFLILTCNIWVTMLEIFYKNNIIKPFPNLNMHRHALQWINGTLPPLNSFLIVIIGLMVILMILTWYKSNLGQKVIAIVAILFTFLSSTYFPWNRLLTKIPEISQVIQFPERFLGTAIITILLTLGEGLKLLRLSPSRMVHVLADFVAIVVIFSALGSVITERDFMKNQASLWKNKQSLVNNNTSPHLSDVSVNQIYNALSNSHQLGLAPRYMMQPVPDYLPSKQTLVPKTYYQIKPYFHVTNDLYRCKLSKKVVGNNKRYTVINQFSTKPFNFKKLLGHHSLKISWRQPNSLGRKLMTVPLVKYYHTQVWLDHRRINPPTNKIGLIQLSPRAGIHHLKISYKPFTGFTVVLLLNLVSWLSLIGFWVIKRRNR